MGWFWADTTSSQASSAPSPSRVSAEPPPGCPMHKNAQQPPTLPPPSQDSACPYRPPTNAEAPPTTTPSSAPSYVSRLNPLNYMPSSLSNERQSSVQKVALPLERETSTIPRGDGSGTWEYPSPQQMYNALLRKGYTDTPAEHVESMVAVHNFLNEGAWEEIKDWENRFSSGLSRGWELSSQGEEGAARQMALDALRRHRRGEMDSEPKLLRFMGRPSEPTPKARMMGVMAWLYPSKFPNNPPFDRHDWYVQRRMGNGQSREVRYVIDYYSGPPEPTGEPVFYLDVRPAVDGPTAACERVLRWGGDFWYRASGGSAREKEGRVRA